MGTIDWSASCCYAVAICRCRVYARPRGRQGALQCTLLYEVGRQSTLHIRTWHKPLDPGGDIAVGGFEDEHGEADGVSHQILSPQMERTIQAGFLALAVAMKLASMLYALCSPEGQSNAQKQRICKAKQFALAGALAIKSGKDCQHAKDRAQGVPGSLGKGPQQEVEVGGAAVVRALGQQRLTQLHHGRRRRPQQQRKHHQHAHLRPGPRP